MALRALQYTALFRVVGPLLVTVGGMVTDVSQFFLVYAFVLIGFANAFFVLFALSDEPVSYTRILSEQTFWLLNAVDRTLFDDLVGPLYAVADLLFWGYILLSYFVLLNLLIAVFNSTYEKVQKNAFNEWLFLRMEKMLDFEAQAENTPGLAAFYEELSAMSNSRTLEPDEIDR